MSLIAFVGIAFAGFLTINHFTLTEEMKFFKVNVRLLAKVNWECLEDADCPLTDWCRFTEGELFGVCTEYYVRICCHVVSTLPIEGVKPFPQRICGVDPMWGCGPIIDVYDAIEYAFCREKYPN